MCQHHLHDQQHEDDAEQRRDLAAGNARDRQPSHVLREAKRLGYPVDDETARAPIMNTHEALVELLATRSAKRGNFTLASGRQSSLYIDARLTTMSPEGLVLIGQIGLTTIRDAGWRVDAVGGLTLGADPIAYAISYASARTASPLRAFTVRKEAKTHGTGRLIEGPYRSGDRVAE